MKKYTFDFIIIANWLPNLLKLTKTFISVIIKPAVAIKLYSS